MSAHGHCPPRTLVFTPEAESTERTDRIFGKLLSRGVYKGVLPVFFFRWFRSFREETDTYIPSPIIRIAVKPALRQAYTELSLYHRVFPSGLAPLPVRLIEGTGLDLGMGSFDAAFADELSHDIHFGAIGIGRGGDLVWDAEAVFLPGEAAANSPCKDAWEFGLQSRGQAFILLMLRDLHAEGDELDAAPHRMIGPPDDRLVIRREPHFMRGLEFPEVFSHPPSPDAISPSGLLQECLMQAVALSGFDRGHKSLPEEVRAFRGMSVILRVHEEFCRGLHAVGRQQEQNNHDEGRLPVGPSPVQQKKTLEGFNQVVIGVHPDCH